VEIEVEIRGLKEGSQRREVRMKIHCGVEWKKK
jgi:hypothetical protein